MLLSKRFQETTPPSFYRNRGRSLHDGCSLRGSCPSLGSCVAAYVALRELGCLTLSQRIAESIMHKRQDRAPKQSLPGLSLRRKDLCSADPLNALPQLPMPTAAKQHPADKNRNSQTS